MDPSEVALLINLGTNITEMIFAHLKARGVSDEQIAAISDDYRARIARREAESK